MIDDEEIRRRSMEADLRERAWLASLREDTVTNTVDDAARYERERAEAAGEYDDTRPGWGDI